jgi:predicted ArsR family transcriptional regulator
MQVTREHILKILQERGVATVEELGKELKLTSATIRHHLDTLRGEGLIEAPAIRRRATPGRPQYVYTLTEAAAQHFPKNYAGLANMILSEVKERLEPKELDQVLRSIANRLADECPPAPPGEDLETRLKRVVKFLNEKGYMASYREHETGYSLRITNCPYRIVAHTHAQLCKVDMTLIGQLLNITPRRSSHIVTGEDACTFYLNTAAPDNSNASAMAS